MLNDEWTLDDKLGHKIIVDNVIKTIEDINPPFTLGIYGGWGSGKTSVMKQIYYKIGGNTKSYLFPFTESPEDEEVTPDNKKMIKLFKKDRKNYESVWFNPWKHELEANPLLGLLHEIREHFNLYNKSTTGAKKLASVSIRAGLDIITSTIKNITDIEMSASNIVKHGENYENSNFETKSSTQNFRLIFESAIKKLLEERKDQKLIIFIDDLDRCTDQKIIKLLEGIKLYLSTSNCIFIFGMDKNNVVNALKNSDINEEYLDKLFQSVIRIPISTQYQSFFTSNIIKKYFSAELKTVPQKLEFSTLVTDIVEKNPRKIKNFANSLKFYWDIKTDATLDLKIFTLFHYLRIHYEDIFEMIERDHSLFQYLFNTCKKEPANVKIEGYFNTVLENPIMEIVNTSSTNAGAVLNKAQINNDEQLVMKNTRIKFKALDSFKNHFANYCSGLNTTKLPHYLGVI
jgi:hypothetical protein